MKKLDDNEMIPAQRLAAIKWLAQGLCLVVLFVACGQNGARPVSDDDTGTGPHSAAAPSAQVVSPGGPIAVHASASGVQPGKDNLPVDPSKIEKLTPAMRVAWIKARQSEATDDYRIRPIRKLPPQGLTAGVRATEATVHFRAYNKARKLTAEFTSHGVRVAKSDVLASSDAGRIGLRLERWGRAGAAVLAVMGSAKPTLGKTMTLDDQGQPGAEVQNRVNYAHPDGLTEWYQNGPYGLEQGLTLSRRPNGEGELVFDVAITGSDITLVSRDNVIEFHAGPGVVVGQYRDLFAEDATGHLIPATLSVVEGLARVTVDDSGAQYPIIVDPTVWLIEAKLIAQTVTDSDSRGETRVFGSSVAIDGNTMAVGLVEDDLASVDIWEREGAGWRLHQNLAVGTIANGSGSITALALAGDTLVVGDAFADDVERGDSAGAAYVFVRNGSFWSYQVTLHAETNDGSTAGNENAHFGESVAVRGATVAIGSPGDDELGGDSGAVYLYVRRGNDVTMEQWLLPESAEPAGDRFGSSLSFASDYLAVGAERSNEQGSAAGSVYVFSYSSNAWSLEQQVFATFEDGTPDDSTGKLFGSSISLSGQTLVVGAIWDSERANSAGAAYVFGRVGNTWVIQQKLLASLPDGGEVGLPDDSFGVSVSLSGDRLAIGSDHDDEAGFNSGAVYVYTRSGSRWALGQRLLPELPSGESDAVGYGLFGGAVGLSGGSLAIGATAGEAVYALALEEGFWQVSQKLEAEVSSVQLEPESARFGEALSLYGNTLVVGAPKDFTSSENFGSVFVFVRNGEGWSFQQRIRAMLPGETSDVQSESTFGSSVSLQENIVAIGAPSDTNSAGESVGAVYLYERSAGTWTATKKILREAPIAIKRARFGASVTLFGGRLLVGSPGDDEQADYAGAAYLYEGADWSLTQKLFALSDEGTREGESNDNFGEAVSLLGASCAIGAPNQGATNSGAVYVLVREDSTWTLQQKVLPELPDGTSDERPSAYFGSSVSLDGDTLAVGAPRDNEQGQSTGAAYVFSRSGSTWESQQKLLAVLPDGTSDSSTGQYFGRSVALLGEQLVVGADERFSFLDSYGPGRAYHFERAAEVWSPRHKFVATLSGDAEGAEAFRAFGHAVALSEDTLAVGVPADAPLGTDTGSVYLFRYADAAAGGVICLSDDACESGSCLDGVCCAVSCPGLCNSCSSALTGESDGVCSPLQEGTACGEAPMRCLAASTDVYELAPTCDGAGACATRSLQCDDGLACVQSGAYGQCVNDCRLALTAHGGCAEAYWCTPDGSCATDRGAGEGCDDDEECASNECSSDNTCQQGAGAECASNSECAAGRSCVDGVCCSGECGLCETCNGSSPGECEQIVDTAPVEGRCDGIDSACGGWCDGTKADECYYPGGACGDAVCSASGELADPARVTGNVCSNGTCEVGGTSTCNNYRTCNAELTDCGTGCSSDTDCVQAAYCDSTDNSCKRDKADAGLCETNAQCSSNNCVDGVCCNSGCGEQCEACDVEGSIGICSLVPTSEAPRGGRAACSSDENCGGYCDGSNNDACFYPGGACGVASCAASIDPQEAAKLTGAVCVRGACESGETSLCGLTTTCNASQTDCASECIVDADCTFDAYCDQADLSCKFDVGLGGECSRDEECGLLVCADGVCCENSCSGVCESCNIPSADGGSDPDAGRCRALSGTPQLGHGECGGHSDCGGVCDGIRADECTFAVDEQCGGSRCQAGFVTSNACNVNGACVEASERACTGNIGVCQSSTACLATCERNADCLAGFLCDRGVDECVRQLSNGNTCESNDDCEGQQCVDGVCCNSACDGACEICDAAGSEGTCSATDTPHDRPTCGGEVECAGACNGVDGECRFPGDATSCAVASCEGSILTPPSTCDGSGGCAEQTLQDCGAYTCNDAANACTTSCSSSDECSAGSACDTTAQECVPSVPVCANAFVVRSPDGSQETCTPYICESGACLRDCQSNAECADEYECRGGTCEEVVETPDSDDSDSPGVDGGAEARDAGGSRGPDQEPVQDSVEGSGDGDECGCRIVGNQRAPAPLSPLLLLGLGLGLIPLRRRYRTVGYVRS